MKKKSYFDYDDGLEITKGAFRISASQVSRFFDNTASWYREHLLGETGFTGNTSTHLGTCVHAGIEMFVDNGEVDYQQIEQYIDSISDPEVDKTLIYNQYEPMLGAVLPFVERHRPSEVEKFVFHEILPGIGAGGSIDALQGCVVQDSTGTNKYQGDVTIMDWKTTGQKTPPTRFSRSYWFQLMTYAWVLKQQGVNVRWLKLVYVTQNETGRISEKTGKPLKDYPAEVSTVVEEVTEANLELIGSCLQLIAESVHTWNTKPELRYLLAQDLRLKVTKPTLFKKD